MKTKLQISFTRKTLLGVALLVVLWAIVGAGNLPAVQAQAEPTSLPSADATDMPQEPAIQPQVEPNTCPTCTANLNKVLAGTYSPNGVSEFNSTDNSLARSGLVWPIYPQASAITPDGKLLFMAGWGRGTIYGMDIPSYKIMVSIPIRGNDQRGLVISKDGTRLYVADNYFRQITVIDLLTNTEITEILLSAHPEQIALSPDNSRLFIAANAPGELLVVDTRNKLPSRRIIPGSSLRPTLRANCWSWIPRPTPC
jgi:YVTN family beta-propeller protein